MKTRLSSLTLLFALFVCTSAFGGHRFHASAFAVAGEDRSAVGSVALPSTGGVTESVVRDYDDGFVRFAEARSVVRGVKEGNVAVTTTEITITDLSFGDRIYVDRLVARTNSRQSIDAPEATSTSKGPSWKDSASTTGASTSRSTRAGSPRIRPSRPCARVASSRRPGCPASPAPRMERRRAATAAAAFACPTSDTSPSGRST